MENVINLGDSDFVVNRRLRQIVAAAKAPPEPARFPLSRKTGNPEMFKAIVMKQETLRKLTDKVRAIFDAYELTTKAIVDHTKDDKPMTVRLHRRGEPIGPVFDQVIAAQFFVLSDEFSELVEAGSGKVEAIANADDLNNYPPGWKAIYDAGFLESYHCRACLSNAQDVAALCVERGEIAFSCPQCGKLNVEEL